MAQVIGRPGLDALRKTEQELNKAHAELYQALHRGHPYVESEIDAVYAAVNQPRSWLKGAQGECRTAAVLDALPDNFVVFHDFHARSKRCARKVSNIDHIVVGPPGVFVIDTKNHGSALIESADVSPWTSHHVDAVRSQALWVKSWISLSALADLARVFVQGVVAYARDDVHVEHTSERDVWLLPLTNLEGRICEAPGKLTPNQVALIRRVLAERRALTPSL